MSFRNYITAAVMCLVLIGVSTTSLQSARSNTGSMTLVPQSNHETSRSELIDSFDRVVQKRFHNILNFGMARIASEGTFVPENDEEIAAVRSLKKAKLKVAIFIAGRFVLHNEPTREQFYNSGFFKRAITHAIFLPSDDAKRQLPERFRLMNQAQQAMIAFGEGKDLYEFSIDTWNVRAHAIRASEECLPCHKEDYKVVFEVRGSSFAESIGNVVHVGDPLGAMLYLSLARDQSNLSKPNERNHSPN